MDLKVAHTTNRIVDPKTVKKRQEYSSLEALESDRSTIKYTMDDKELRDYTKMKEKQVLLEKQREDTQKKLDMLNNQQFEKANRLFLGQ